MRSGSAASHITPADLPMAALRDAGVVVASGVTCAVSATACATVFAAARAAHTFVYDPNWRPRLIDAGDAALHLADLAPMAALVTPAWPVEAQALLGDAAVDPSSACNEVRRLGARAVALTRGPLGVLLDDGEHQHDVPAVTPPRLVDQTGAGDVLTGTVAARMSLGDDLLTATRLAVAAAALSLQGAGGTGYLPSLSQTRAAAAQSSSVEVTS